MPIHSLTFPSLNVSVQVNDLAYITQHQNKQAGKNHHQHASYNTKPMVFGLITYVNHVTKTIKVASDLAGGCGSDCPGYGNILEPSVLESQIYIFFQKDHQINTSGVTGYYMETEFINHSNFPAEIFATAVDYVESSK